MIQICVPLIIPPELPLITDIKMKFPSPYVRLGVLSLFVLSSLVFFLYRRLTITSAFDQFLETHQIAYKSPEEKRIRSYVFYQNLLLIQEHNEAHPETVLRMNKFGDLSLDEFERLYMAPIDDAETPRIRSAPEGQKRGERDWSSESSSNLWKRTQVTYASPVPIAVVQSIEHYTETHLSVQQLIDCYSWHGTFAAYFDYIADFGGLMKDSDYPMVGYPGECLADPSKIAFSIKGHVDLQFGDQEELKKSVSDRPVVVGIDAKALVLQFYGEGIIESDCDHYINTAGLLVGYGVEKGKKYWKVLTSFGEDWGELSFVRILMTDDSSGPGVCGIATSMAYPQV